MQVGSQIAFQAEDNRRFAQSILVDEQLQYLLEENVKGNEFRRQSQYDKVTKRLVFYNNLRTYLEGSILQMADGSFFGSSRPFCIWNLWCGNACVWQGLRCIFQGNTL